MPPELIRAPLASDLPALLALYQHLNADDPLLDAADLAVHWRAMLDNPALHYFVADIDGALVASCTLTIIPNLTRSARPYGLIENVVTHPDWRQRGIATRLLHAARERAWQADCYKVMLMTSRKDEATLRFYAQAGFVAGDKTAFIARAAE